MDAVTRKLLTDRPIAYHPMLARAVGGVTTALFLSQLLYWSDKGADADGWIWKTQADWEEETGLTRYQQETARKHLRGHGVIEEQLAGLPAKMYYRVNFDILYSVLAAQTTMEENQRQAMEANPPPAREKTPYVYGGKPQTIIRNPEITTESTSEIKSKNLNFSESTEDQTLWPKWYTVCHLVPGWKTDLVLAAAWLAETGISEDLAEIKAYALCDWWARLPEDGKRRQHGDPYKTWQNWCRQDRDKHVHLPEDRNGELGGNSNPYEAAAAAQQLRRAAGTNAA